MVIYGCLASLQLWFSIVRCWVTGGFHSKVRCTFSHHPSDFRTLQERNHPAIGVPLLLTGHWGMIFLANDDSFTQIYPNSFYVCWHQSVFMYGSHCLERHIIHKPSHLSSAPNPIIPFYWLQGFPVLGVFQIHQYVKGSRIPEPNINHQGWIAATAHLLSGKR